MFAQSLSPVEAHALRTSLNNLNQYHGADPDAEPCVFVTDTLRSGNSLIFTSNNQRVVISDFNTYKEFLITLYKQDTQNTDGRESISYLPHQDGSLRIRLSNFKSLAVLGILHVSVGSDEWEPTSEDLEEITRIFASVDATAHATVVATRRDIHPSLYSVTPDTVLVVTVGSKDWNPSDENIADVKRMFVEARTLDPKGSVVVTRPDSKVESRTVENPAELVVVQRYGSC